MSKNHYICKVECLINGGVIASRYFDGTQAQAIKYFKSEPIIKKHLKNDNYSVYFRANSINLKEV